MKRQLNAPCRPFLFIGLAGTFALGLAACDEVDDDRADAPAGAVQDKDTEGDQDTETEGDQDTDTEQETNSEVEHEPCEAEESRVCELDQEQGGGEGVQFCDGEAPELRWYGCLQPECEPGTSWDCGLGEEFGNPSAYCILVDGVPLPELDACNTPLVLSFDSDPVQFSAAGTAAFDITGGAQCLTTDWPTANTPWLAIDLDKNGSIDGGHELFGNGTRLNNGRFARHGFAALSDLDSNRDGRISALDARFSELVLWSDYDGDRKSTLWELRPLTARGVTSIALDYENGRRCDARGNCAREHAAFELDGGQTSGKVIDVYMTCN